MKPYSLLTPLKSVQKMRLTGVWRQAGGLSWYAAKGLTSVNWFPHNASLVFHTPVIPIHCCHRNLSNLLHCLEFLVVLLCLLDKIDIH